MVSGFQATGEVKFVNDQPIVQGLLFGAAVLSTQGNADIGHISSSRALVRLKISSFRT